MANLNNVKINMQDMCVDRSTPEGEMFERLNRMAAEKAGTPEGNFMSQMLGFTEAATVIMNTMSGKEAEDALGELRRMMSEAAGGQA